MLLLRGLASPSQAGTVDGTITLNADLSAHPSEEPIRIWLPYPASDTDQDIIKQPLDWLDPERFKCTITYT